MKNIILKKTKELENWRQNLTGAINFIPTMGNLHDGHKKLISTAKNSSFNINLVSIFINPLQFENKEDLDNYPKSIDNDIQIAFSVHLFSSVAIFLELVSKLLNETILTIMSHFY